MADLTKTITNSMNVLGVSPGQHWGTFQWNTNWGNDEDVWTDTNKQFPITLTIENILTKHYELTITNTIDLTENLTSVERELGIWDYVFTKPTTTALEQVYDEFSKQADASTTYAAVADASTTWTEA